MAYIIQIKEINQWTKRGWAVPRYGSLLPSESFPNSFGTAPSGTKGSRTDPSSSLPSEPLFLGILTGLMRGGASALAFGVNTSSSISPEAVSCASRSFRIRCLWGSSPMTSRTSTSADMFRIKATWSQRGMRCKVSWDEKRAVIDRGKLIVCIGCYTGGQQDAGQPPLYGKGRRQYTPA